MSSYCCQWFYCDLFNYFRNSSHVNKITITGRMKGEGKTPANNHSLVKTVLANHLICDEKKCVGDNFNLR